MASRIRRAVGPPDVRNLRPPRYRLLAAAAALPPRPAVRASVSFERECPSCGRPVTVVQTEGGDEVSIEDHDCRVPTEP